MFSPIGSKEVGAGACPLPLEAAWPDASAALPGVDASGVPRSLASKERSTLSRSSRLSLPKAATIASKESSAITQAGRKALLEYIKAGLELTGVFLEVVEAPAGQAT